MAGYSGTPLVKKLGIKPHSRISIMEAPDKYIESLDDLPEVVWVKNRKEKKDFIQFFVTKKLNLVKEIFLLRNEIEEDGIIWISWPKKSGGMTTDITEDVIRNLALQNELVDVKVCAVDETWSALKLVIPVKDRKKRS